MYGMACTFEEGTEDESQHFAHYPCMGEVSVWHNRNVLTRIGFRFTNHKPMFTERKLVSKQTGETLVQKIYVPNSTHQKRWSDKKEMWSGIHSKHPELQPYIEYLNIQDWTFFMTGTTHYELTQKSARRLAERYFLKLYPYCERMFWVSERFECKDGHHIHALMYCPQEAHFSVYNDMWQIATGNNKYKVNKETLKTEFEGKHSRIQLKRYVKSLGAEGYVAKYILKAHGDYDLYTGV